jgi:hypothetical protein
MYGIFNASQRETSLKSKNGLPAAQMYVQDRLTEACFNADLELVKELISKHGADPAVPDKDGQQPLAAAIWGLSQNVVDYLQSCVPYTERDWATIAADVQNRHGILLPMREKINNYKQWYNHFRSGDAPWLYNLDAFGRRTNINMNEVWGWSSEIQQTYVAQQGFGAYNGIRIMVKGCGSISNFFNNMGVTPIDKYRENDSIDSSSWHKNQISEFENLCNNMVECLRSHRINVAENYQLISDNSHSSIPVPR